MPIGARFESCPRSLGDELVGAGVCQRRETMRGRSAVGRDALNVLMLVRFQPPQLAATKETEVIRLDEEPVLKTGGGTDRLWVRVPRLPLIDDTTHVPGVMAARLAPTQLVRVQVLGGVPWANVRP